MHDKKCWHTYAHIPEPDDVVSHERLNSNYLKRFALCTIFILFNVY